MIKRLVNDHPCPGIHDSNMMFVRPHDTAVALWIDYLQHRGYFILKVTRVSKRVFIFGDDITEIEYTDIPQEPGYY